MELFTQFGGAFVSRWFHVLAGITWIGLLYYFNFVQVPAFAQLEPGTRNQAMDKITWRALWWFRWSALATAGLGILILGFEEHFDGDYFKTPSGLSISIGMLLGLTMFANVWMIIWPAQQVVIGNARNVLAGGEANPDAPAAARTGALASRMNTIFSIPMLMFMVGTSHFFLSGRYDATESSNRVLFLIISSVIWAVLELNALGIIGGKGQNASNWMYETHRNAIISGFALAAIYYLLFELILSA